MKKLFSGLYDSLLAVFFVSSSAGAADTSYDISSFLLGKDILFGTFLGFLIGFTIKKSIKLVLFLMGVILIILIVLNKYDLLVINWSNFENLYNEFIASYNFKQLLNNILEWFKSSIAVTGSFSVGFFAGIKIG